jgi:selenocysteine-specific elongation factor
VTARLAALLQGSESGALLTLLDERGPLPAADLVRISQMPAAAGGTALAALIEEGAAVTLAPGDAVPTDLSRWQGLVMSRAAWDRAMERATLLLQAFHRAQPLREGMPREEFRSRLSLGADWANAFLERAGATGFLRLSPEWVALAGHRVALSAQDERALQALLARFRAEPQSPPAMPDVEAAVGGALATFLLESGRLVRLSDSVVYDADTFGAMIDRLKTEIGPGKTFTVAQVRDLFGTSRKYAVAFLEEMDRRRITRRIGDERVVR